MSAIRNAAVDSKPHQMSQETLQHVHAFNAVLPAPGQKLSPPQQAAIGNNAVRFNRHTGHGKARHPVIQAPQAPKPGFLEKLANFLAG